MLTPDTRRFKIPAARRRTTAGALERVASSAGASAHPRTWRAGPGRTPGGRGAENVGSFHLTSPHLISSHLTASSPGRRRIPASSGVAPSEPGLPAGRTCRGRRSWARKAGPPCVGHRAESSLSRGWGKKGRVAGRRCRSVNVRRHG